MNTGKLLKSGNSYLQSINNVNADENGNISGVLTKDVELTEVEQAEIKEKLGITELPNNSNYSVLNKGEFIDLFEEDYNILQTSYTDSYLGTNPIDDNYYFFRNGQHERNKIEGLVIQCLKPGVITLGVTLYNYDDIMTMPSFVLGTIKGFEEELCTITLTEEDVNQRRIVAFNGFSSKVTNLNSKYWNQEGNYLDLGYSAVLGFKANVGMLGSDGIDRGSLNVSARYFITDSNTVELYQDSIPISFRYFSLGYTVPDLKDLKEVIYEKQDNLIPTGSVSIITEGIYGDNIDILIDETESKGNVNFSSSINGLSASVSVPTFTVQENLDGTKTLIIND